MSDPLTIAGREFRSRLFLGTAGYPNQQVMLDALVASGTEMVTAAIRRINLAGEDETLVDVLGGRFHLLPNTAAVRLRVTPCSSPSSRVMHSTPIGSKSR